MTYVAISDVYAYAEKNVEEATKWLGTLEQMARQHHDLRALGGVSSKTGDILLSSGDLHGGISRYEQALKLFTKVGDYKACFRK